MRLLDNHLERLQQDLLLMARDVKEALGKAIASLQTRNPYLAKQVMEGDSLIDQEENHVEEECLKILLLFQPVAEDLRRVVAILKINTDLERMADLAENIAGSALHLASLPAVSIPDQLQSMSDLTVAMVKQSLDAFVGFDTVLARQVLRLDAEVSRHSHVIIRDLTEMMKNSPEAVEAGMSLFSAVRHVGRIADHATNIAEDVVYLVQGTIIRHQTEAAAGSCAGFNVSAGCG